MTETPCEPMLSEDSTVEYIALKTASDDARITNAKDSGLWLATAAFSAATSHASFIYGVGQYWNWAPFALQLASVALFLTHAATHESAAIIPATCANRHAEYELEVGRITGGARKIQKYLEDGITIDLTAAKNRNLMTRVIGTVASAQAFTQSYMLATTDKVVHADSHLHPNVGAGTFAFLGAMTVGATLTAHRKFKKLRKQLAQAKP